MSGKLPPGQKDLGAFPRFGLNQYANRFPQNTKSIHLSISGDVGDFEIDQEQLFSLQRIQQTSDFHCVTTWSATGLRWSGFRFADFYNHFIKPKIVGDHELKFVVFRAQDGYRTSLLLEDLLADDVMLADQLNGKAVSLEHGAPVRLLTPGHYGYKNLKHLDKMEFYFEIKKIRKSSLNFMDHPRARVALEERAIGGPGWFFRYLYRPLVSSTVKMFDKAMQQYYADNNISPKN